MKEVIPKRKFRIGRFIQITFQILILWGYYTTYFYTNSNVITILRIVITLLYPLMQICYIRTSTMDPGVVLQKTVPLKLQLIHSLYQNICQKCNTWKPPRAHHCKRCNQCIFRMDHHCEWTNNCIGALNHKYFFQFLIYVLVYILFVFLIHIIGICIFCMNQKRQLWTVLMNITATKCQVLGVTLFCMFFTIFVSQLLFDQFQVIWDNQTAIESHQGKYGRQQSFMDNLKQYLGDDEWYYWFIPTKPTLKLNYAELVYSEQLINQGTQFLEDTIYDQNNPASQHFSEFMLDNYYKKNK